MAAAGRTESPDLNPEAVSGFLDPPNSANAELAEILRREPCTFAFFQAVRLLERLAPGRKTVGRFVKPSTEVARFGVHPSLNFPASEIQSIQQRSGEPPFVEVNFMGLSGPLGVLPHAYTELVRERIRQKDTTLRDFLDIFHHRIISLFYQAWEKYRFAIAYERDERDRFSHHLLDLIGLGTPGLENRQDVADDSLLYYCGLLSMNTRSAAALEQVLAGYFEVDVAIDQFVGAWYPMDLENQCHIGEETGPSEQLGWGAIAGDEIWDLQSRIRIRLGPLSLAQYQEFLPGQNAWLELRALARFFTRGEFDIEVQLVLDRKDVPPCELGEETAGAPQLGWSTWVKSTPMNRDPDDTILLLE
jgi:type VI secretion system protein ImpH